jgi:caa(3)-type oxidase subunit IV
MSGHAHHPNYVKIWAILVVLLVVSVFGPFLEIRIITLITAFGIALVKAYMVAKNFMHVDVEKPIIHWMMVTALVFMVLLFAGVAPDVMKEDGSRWVKDPVGFHPQPAGGHGDHGEGGAPAGGGHEPAPGPQGGSAHDSTDGHGDSH